METPIPHVLVLLHAFRTHPEPLHAGSGAVVRHGLDNGITGTAMGTVGKRIMIAPGRRIAHLPEALRARSQVRQHDRHAAGSGIALQNQELFIPGRLANGLFRSVNAGMFRQAFHQFRKKTFGIPRISLHADLHAGLRIAHEAFQAETRGQPIHVGPEADPLNHAGNVDLQG